MRIIAQSDESIDRIAVVHAAASSELAENYYFVSTESQLGVWDLITPKVSKLNFV